MSLSNTNKYFYLQTGCAASEKSHQIYENIESENAAYTAAFIKMICVGVVTTSLTSAMFPISHAVFGYPPPEMWHLTLEIQ